MVASSGDEAVRNARDIKSGYSGMCQKFTRVSWEVGSLYGSAIDAWNGADEKHPGDRTPPKGAPCYYRGGSYGHAVVYVGDGKVRSTDYPSAGQIGEVSLGWFESAWGYDYLGWTGDINQVDLPLGGGSGEEDEVKEKDIEAIAQRVNKTLGDFDAEGKPQNPDNKDPEWGDQRIRQIENKVDDLKNKVDRVLDKLK